MLERYQMGKYQMAEIDVLAEYSADRVRTNARIYQELLRKASQGADIASSQEVVRQHLRGYLDLQLDRLYDWAEGPVDLLALVTRSLLELLFWTEYVLAAKQNAQRFLEEQRIDLAELVRKAISAFETEAKGMFDENPEGLAALLTAKGKRVETSRRGELDAYTFKLCSKYIHPSSWLLIDLNDRLNSEMNRKLFWMMSLRYAANISALLTLVPPLK
jgi:hypothetical protein